MRFETIVTTLLSFLLAIFTALTGILFIIAPHYPREMERIFFELTMQAHKAYTIGGALIVFAFVLFCICLSLSRREYSTLRMGGYSISAKVLGQVAYNTLQKFFKSEECDCIVEISSFGKVEIIAALPYVEEEKREQILEKLEEALTFTLSSQCGFEKPFAMKVTFKKGDSRIG